MVKPSGRAAVFVDRDGVLNRAEVREGKPFAPQRVEHFKLLPGVAAAMRQLREAGYCLVVVTNQPDIGNGLVGEAIVAAIHQKLRARVPVDDIRVCPHSQEAGCDCRKPKPGMLLAAASEHHIDLASSYIIGDRISDVIAGNAAGCYTIFVKRGYPECEGLAVPARAAVRSLPQAVRYILARDQRRSPSRNPSTAVLTNR
jgi:D-glycero-D-manno-heptose 1,7-bisphosphate phosphatase